MPLLLFLLLPLLCRLLLFLGGWSSWFSTRYFQLDDRGRSRRESSQYESLFGRGRRCSVVVRVVVLHRQVVGGFHGRRSSCRRKHRRDRAATTTTTTTTTGITLTTGAADRPSTTG